MTIASCDSHKEIITISPHFPGRPHLSRSAYYVNLLEEATSDYLVTVHCRTYQYLPTFIVWKKNEVEVSVDGENYEALQSIRDRYNSVYLNTLIIRDVAGILDEPVYTCVVGNVGGIVSSSIEIDISLTISFSGTYMYVHVYRLLFSQCTYRCVHYV